jgi:hypothetical protein
LSLVQPITILIERLVEERQRIIVIVRLFESRIYIRLTRRNLLHCNSLGKFKILENEYKAELNYTLSILVTNNVSGMSIISLCVNSYVLRLILLALLLNIGLRKVCLPIELLFSNSFEVYLSRVSEVTLNLYDIASKQTASKLGEVEIDGEFPIGCSFIDGDRIALLTNNAVHIYDKNCKETEELTFYGESIRAFEVSADGVAVVTGSESEKNVRAFDKKGNLVYNSSIAENVSALSLEGGYLFMRTATGVIRIDIRKEESEFLACDNGKMLVYGEDTAMVCGDARAEYLVFGKKQ